MLNLVRDLTWPDFKAFVVDSSITLKRVKEKYYQRRTTHWQISFHVGEVWRLSKLHPCLNPIPKTAQEIIIHWNDIKQKAKGRFREFLSIG